MTFLSDMNTSNFEAVKVAIKQDKSGYVLTLSIHPDDVPEEILRDFVGARYQFVAVRLNDDQTPYPRKNGVISAAGILCRSPAFWDWLTELGEITERTEEQAVEALHRICGINSRSELTTPERQQEIDSMVIEFKRWQKDKPPF
jgi:hypothetical protein